MADRYYSKSKFNQAYSYRVHQDRRFRVARRILCFEDGVNEGGEGEVHTFHASGEPGFHFKIE